MQGALTVGELYYATPAFLRAAGVSNRIAYINPPPQWSNSDDQFSRDVASNHNGSLEVFATEDEAVEWLLAEEEK